MNPSDFFALAKENNAEMVDLKFVDLLGTWQHCSYPIETWDEGTFEDGVGFDGSSIRGWKAINVSDMLAVPDAGTGCIDPFYKEPTISVIANIVDPITKEDYTRDPRQIARKGVEYLKQTGIADTCYVGPEPEFFIFDEVRFQQTQNIGYYEIDSVEGAWNTSRIEGLSRLCYPASLTTSVDPSAIDRADARGSQLDPPSLLRQLGPEWKNVHAIAQRAHRAVFAGQVQVEVDLILILEAEGG